MFGKSVPDLPEAFDATQNCEILLAVGTSGIVYPAAQLPFEAKNRDATIIVINPNENAFASVSDIFL